MFQIHPKPSGYSLDCPRSTSHKIAKIDQHLSILERIYKLKASDLAKFMDSKTNKVWWHDSLTHAICINNLAANQIQSQNYEVSIQGLSLALDYIKATMEKTLTCVKHDAPRLQFRQVESDRLGAGSVYTHPQYLPSCCGSVDLAATVILFNLALAHQLLAQDPKYMDGQTMLLQNAAMFYEVSLNLHRQRVPAEEEVLTMATLNNLSLVNKALGYDEAAKDCSRRLLFLLLQQGDFDNIPPCYEIFLRNTQFYNNTAAAAA